MDYKLTHDDYLNQLKDVIISMQTLAQAYDQGKFSLSKDLATKLRMLFHDTSRSTSLISYLDWRDKIKMVSHMPVPNPEVLMVLGDGLYGLQHGIVNNEAYGFYFPSLDKSQSRYLSFEEWWNENVFKNVIDSLDVLDTPIWHSRKDILINHCNKEGGAHINSKIPEIVHKSSMAAASGWGFFDDNGPIEAINTPKDATVRAITGEVLISLFNADSSLFSEQYF